MLYLPGPPLLTLHKWSWSDVQFIANVTNYFFKYFCSGKMFEWTQKIPNYHTGVKYLTNSTSVSGRPYNLNREYSTMYTNYVKKCPLQLPGHLDHLGHLHVRHREDHEQDDGDPDCWGRRLAQRRDWGGCLSLITPLLSNCSFLGVVHQDL